MNSTGAESGSTTSTLRTLHSLWLPRAEASPTRRGQQAPARPAPARCEPPPRDRIATDRLGPRDDAVVRRVPPPIPERRGEFRRAREPVRRQLGQRGQHRVLHVARHRLALERERPRLFGHHLGDDRLRRGSGERRLADQHLVRHAAQRVDVGRGGDLPLAHRLLGAHVVRGAQRHPGLGHPGAAGGWLTASAIPKSATSACPSCSRMFSGLMSRWITPCRWA